MVALATRGAVALALLPAALSSYGRRSSSSALGVLVAVLAVVCASAGGIGVFVFRRGRRVAREGRFPVSGEGVMRDTVVLSGEAALRRGRILEALGVTLVLVAVALSMLSWRLYALFSARTP